MPQPATDEVYLLIGYENCYPSPDNTIRAFDNEHAAEKWCVILECASDDAHFPITYAELKQEFDWIPEHTSMKYDVVSHKIHSKGWADNE